VRTFLGGEAIAFAIAALVHAGVVIGGYQHREARIAESVIAGVLTLGLLVSLMHPRASRVAGFAAQGFALLGTLVGITMIIIGVGPQTAFDVTLHVGFVTLLVAGLVIVARQPASNSPNPGGAIRTSRRVMS
jgi:hypothetical protein